MHLYTSAWRHTNSLPSISNVTAPIPTTMSCNDNIATHPHPTSTQEIHLTQKCHSPVLVHVLSLHANQNTKTTYTPTQAWTPPSPHMHYHCLPHNFYKFYHISSPINRHVLALPTNDNVHLPCHSIIIDTLPFANGSSPYHGLLCTWYNHSADCKHYTDQL